MATKPRWQDNVTWEDTGRFYGSAVGPNISDMTIVVLHPWLRPLPWKAAPPAM
ncbi:MAG: hypothetical protein WBG32_17860 [Nodosilinea sp.]